MIDRPFTARAELLRAPDLRLADVNTGTIVLQPGGRHQLSAVGRSIFAYVIDGTFALQADSKSEGVRHFPAGTAVGIEDGRPLVWTLAQPGVDGTGRLFFSSIPRRVAVLQRLTDGLIVVPPDAEPFATTIRLAVDLHLAQFERTADVRNDPIVNRCAEICLIQFIGFARAGLSAGVAVPHAIGHDEQLLAAWTAYFADPRRRWTVRALADVAGLGRTAFAIRFRNAFGMPPLHALTALRLEQAEAMLRDKTLPLIEIAFTVGYNSEAAFVRAFHRHHGITPGRFRASLSVERAPPTASLPKRGRSHLRPHHQGDMQ